MRYLILALQAIFIAGALGIGIYVIITASDLYSLANDCGFADLPNRPLSETCGLMPRYSAQAIAMVAWALFALILVVAAAAIRPLSGPRPTPSAWPQQQMPPQQYGPQSGGQPPVGPRYEQQPPPR